MGTQTYRNVRARSSLCCPPWAAGCGKPCPAVLCWGTALSSQEVCRCWAHRGWELSPISSTARPGAHVWYTHVYGIHTCMVKAEYDKSNGATPYVEETPGTLPGLTHTGRAAPSQRELCRANPHRCVHNCQRRRLRVSDGRYVSIKAQCKAIVPKLRKKH